MNTETWLYRHDEIMTGRPYACDVDEQDWLWEGCGPNRLTGHNLRTAEFVQIPVPEMAGRPIYQAFAWDGKLVLTLGEAACYLVYDPIGRSCQRREIPAARAIVWYGTKAPNGKLLLYERSESKALILDGPDAAPRAIACPFDGQLASGTPLSDGLVYSTLTGPTRIVRFDPVKERFVDQLPLPPSGSTVTPTTLEHDGVAYFRKAPGGQLVPLELATRKWLDPIPTPDYGKVYGFVGGNFSFRGKLFACLSTYAHQSRLDPRTGKIIIPEGPLSVDGREPRFLDRYLVFDPATQTFDYLVAPAQPDGIPLLCYNWTDGARFAITGIVIPFDEPGEPGVQYGHWLVLQSEPADREPPFRSHDTNFDRRLHLARNRRGYEAFRSLYLPEPPWTPPIVNSRGPATQYSPGREAELVRRAAKTDSQAYIGELARTLTENAESDAEKVKRIAGFVNHTLYYNPIQEMQSSDLVAILESHDARCGRSVTVTVALLKAAGVEARSVELFHHVVAEATYDGGDHIVDALFFGVSQPSRDGRVLSVEELKDEPYFADAFPQECFAYDPELLHSEDGFWVEGYVFGTWGSEPYYSYYLGAPKEHPPTLPFALPAQRAGGDSVRLNWSRSIKLGGGPVEYDVRVHTDRACKEKLCHAVTAGTSLLFKPPELNRMYFVEVRAMDDHRAKEPDTWYPAARSNFVPAPEDQYGWYGVL